AERHDDLRPSLPRQHGGALGGRRRLRSDRRTGVLESRRGRLLPRIRIGAGRRLEPLRFMPKDKRVVLGLVSSKVPEMETKDALKRRVGEAAKFMSSDSMGISPQCGFASGYQGNPVTEDIERRKLALCVETATELWGSAK